MLRQIYYLYIKLLKNMSYFDILTLIIVTISANEWYSLVALGVVIFMQLLQIYSAVDYKLLKPKLAFYSGNRKIILRFCVMFCTGVAFKAMYIVAFSTVDIQTKCKLLSEIILGFIVMPHFSDWLIKWETNKKI